MHAIHEQQTIVCFTTADHAQTLSKLSERNQAIVIFIYHLQFIVLKGAGENQYSRKYMTRKEPIQALETAPLETFSLIS